LIHHHQKAVRTIKTRTHQRHHPRNARCSQIAIQTRVCLSVQPAKPMFAEIAVTPRKLSFQLALIA
jgi:hypothetical protein